MGKSVFVRVSDDCRANGFITNTAETGNILWSAELLEFRVVVVVVDWIYFYC